MILFTYLYMGPDQLMPLASGIATVIGFVLIFGRYALGFARRVLGLSKKDAASLAAATELSPGVPGEPATGIATQPDSNTHR